MPQSIPKLRISASVSSSTSINSSTRNLKSLSTCQCLVIGILIGFSSTILIWKQIMNTCSFDQEVSNSYQDPNIIQTFTPDVHTTTETPQIVSENTKTDDKFVLIGVMTANKYISSRAVAVYNTWARKFAGKIIFFTGGNATHEFESQSEASIPLVRLPGVDDSYPPQKKSFMMLKYMYDNYVEEYEWFLRADDDLYIHTDKLEEFLRSLNSNYLYFIGQAGRGSRAERGTLHLAHNENFCMGGPGNLFSHATLRKVAPHVSECLSKMYSTHEDVELGRCVHRFTGISCTWAYEMQSIFYHNSSGDHAFTGRLKHKEVHRAITLHPIKNQDHMYRLHSYFQEREIDKLLYEAIQLQRDLLYTETELQKEGIFSENTGDADYVTAFDSYDITGLRPSLDKFTPREAEAFIEWSFIGKHGLNTPNTLNPSQKLNSANKEALQDVIRELMEMINSLSKVRGRVIEFKELLYGYHRVDPLHGEDFVLDLLMTYRKYRGKKMTVPVRRHAYIQRPFAPLQLRIKEAKLDIKSPSKLVFIVPLSGRIPTFERFLQNYVFVCKNMKQGRGSPNLRLVVVYFGSGVDKEQFLTRIISFKDQIKESSMSDSCEIKVVQLDAEFSRGIGLETGISQCGLNDLLFLVDVDIVISPQAVQRIVANTIQNSQVYFPIVFSQYSDQFYSEDAESFDIRDDTGYWREFGFGIAAFYKSDFKKVGGFDVSIRGWGKEDVALFDKFLQTNLTVFRAPDPEIIHIYHPIDCDPHLHHSQKEMCLGSKARTIGSYKNLLNFILKNRNKSTKFRQVSDTLFPQSA